MMVKGKLGVMRRRARCGPAQHKQSVQSVDHTTIDRSDPQNCNVYVGNVSQEVTEAQLRSGFAQFGSITDVKIHRKGKDRHLVRYTYSVHCASG